MVPKASSPRLGARARAGHVVEHPRELGAGEVGVDHQPGPLADQRLVAVCASADRRTRAVRRSCQTIALWIGCAGLAVPDDGRLALVGDADRGDVAAAAACARPSASTRDADLRRPDLAAGRARPSRAAERSAGTPSARRATMAPSWSKTMARELVVPWSRARMYGTAEPPQKRGEAPGITRSTSPPASCADGNTSESMPEPDYSEVVTCPVCALPDDAVVYALGKSGRLRSVGVVVLRRRLPSPHLVSPSPGFRAVSGAFGPIPGNFLRSPRQRRLAHALLSPSWYFKQFGMAPEGDSRWRDPAHSSRLQSHWR